MRTTKSKKIEILGFSPILTNCAMDVTGDEGEVVGSDPPGYKYF